MTDAPIILSFDPETLRERIDVDAANERLAEAERFRSLTALNEQVTLLRLLGRYDEAFDKAQAAARQSRFTGSREDSLEARIRRAQVEHYRGKLETALGELTNCVDEAVAHEWGALAGFALYNRGKVHVELERLDDALHDFERALKFREADSNAGDQVDATKFAIRAVRAKIEGHSAPDEQAEPFSAIDC
ncbi:tetratricopeptide repeat protein [Gulosibacter bifidus]|uniref:Tetratricopeptide repeat protein n=1 Tax=Gulosibacter bifidus TaxID=272239 RepID=A0ABW5RHZ0_9MICO|nr:tetratricopeptide repeat protein [Gulosibacter bifidus]